MKKIFLTLMITAGLLRVSAQEKGLYFNVGGGLGANTFMYQMDDGDRSTPRLGAGANIGLQYYFNNHWGIGTNIGFTFYNTQGIYRNNAGNDPTHYAFENMMDDDFRNLRKNFEAYTLHVGLSDWKEIQQGYFLEIPLLLMYQTRWGAAGNWGLYFGVGPKVQLPVFGTEYKVEKGSELSTVGYYDAPVLVLPEPNGPSVEQHGFGTNHKITYEGDFEVKTSFAASAEVGLLTRLSPRVDLTYGIYFDYGFNNILNGEKSGNGNLIEPEGGAQTIHPSAYVGDKLAYNGYFNSHVVDKTHLMAVGGRVGLRVKLGRMGEKPAPKEEPVVVVQQPKPATQSYRVSVLDSLTHTPMMTQVAMECTDCDSAHKQDFYSAKEPVATDLYPAKTYKVTTTKLGFASYDTQITTGDSNAQDMVVVMPLHPQITGTVRNNKGHWLPDVDVTVKGSNGREYIGKTNADGYFAVNHVEPGSAYQVVGVRTGYVPDTTGVNIPASPDSLQTNYPVIMELKPVKKIVLSATVLFDLAKFDLRPEAKDEIDRIIPMLKENPNIKITVEGHTDSRSSAAYNEKLSLNRANSVRTYMIEQGIDPKRVTAKGWGFRKLVNKCKPGVKCTEEEHQANRRVEFIFEEKK